MTTLLLFTGARVFGIGPAAEVATRAVLRELIAQHDCFVFGDAPDGLDRWAEDEAIRSGKPYCHFFAFGPRAGMRFESKARSFHAWCDEPSLRFTPRGFVPLRRNDAMVRHVRDEVARGGYQASCAGFLGPARCNGTLHTMGCALPYMPVEVFRWDAASGALHRGPWVAEEGRDG